MFEIGLTVMPRMVKEHGEVIINICLSEIIRDFLEILHSFGHMVAIIGNSTFRILGDSKFGDKQRDAIAVFWYGKYRSVYYRRHSIFRSAGFVWRGCEKFPAISCTYLQERINQQNITALAEAPMTLAFLL
jgi:hypothetical protein